jgi:HK97 family phage major capsid protein
MTIQMAALGQNMNLQEMQQQSLARNEAAAAIEAKYMDSAMPQAENDEVKRLLSEVDVLETNIQALEERLGRNDRIQQSITKYRSPQRPQQSAQGGDEMLSPGDQFTRGGAYLDLKNRGIFNSSLNRVDFGVEMKDGTSLLQWKTLLFASTATSGGSLVANDVRPGILEVLQREINLLDLIPRLQTSSDTVEYVQQSSFTNNAAAVAEATGNARTGTDGTKPESAMAFQTVTAAVRTIAHWLPVTNRMLQDASQIRGFINSQLLLGLALAVEGLVLTGDGTGENFTGILNAGINTMAKGSYNEVDALFHARTVARTASKLAPTAIVLNPVDYEQVRLLRENSASATLGQYLMGPPNTLGIPTVWGLPVIESEAMTADTALVGNFTQGVSLFDREQSAVRVGTINEQFIRNIQTILAEQRAAFVCWRPTAFTRVTGY